MRYVWPCSARYTCITVSYLILILEIFGHQTNQFLLDFSFQCMLVLHLLIPPLVSGGTKGGWGPEPWRQKEKKCPANLQKMLVFPFKRRLGEYFWHTWTVFEQSFSAVSKQRPMFVLFLTQTRWLVRYPRVSVFRCEERRPEGQGKTLGQNPPIQGTLFKWFKCVLDFAVEWKLEEPAPFVYSSLKLFLTIGVSVTSCEQSFSKLNLVWNYLRATPFASPVCQIWTFSLLRELAQSIDFESVIQDFSGVCARKITVFASFLSKYQI